MSLRTIFARPRSTPKTVASSKDRLRSFVRRRRPTSIRRDQVTETYLHSSQRHMRAAVTALGEYRKQGGQEYLHFNDLENPCKLR